MKRPKKRWLATMRTYRWRWPCDSWVREWSGTVEWLDGRAVHPKKVHAYRFVGFTGRPTPTVPEVP